MAPISPFDGRGRAPPVKGYWANLPRQESIRRATGVLQTGRARGKPRGTRALRNRSLARSARRATAAGTRIVFRRGLK